MRDEAFVRGDNVNHPITPGWADNFRGDDHNNLWCGAVDAVRCIAPDGTLLGKVGCRRGC